MSEPNLKPCPFCGSKPVINQLSFGTKPNGIFTAGYEITCPNCRIYFAGQSEFSVSDGMPVVKKDSYSECINKWNQRV